MIKLADITHSFSHEIRELSLNNPFGCRINALYKTYNYNLPFVDFWVQFVGRKPVSLISRLDSAYVLRLTVKSDIGELSAFIRISGAETVLCDSNYELDCNMKKAEGPILYSDEAFEISKGFEVYTPSVKDVYSIISKAASDSFRVPSYESFMLDVNHKLNKRTVRMYGLKEIDVPAACVMTLAESADSAVLGALATDPSLRKKGYGAFLIRYINNVLTGEGKRVYLHRARNENISFYHKTGFKEFGFWAEYKGQ